MNRAGIRVLLACAGMGLALPVLSQTAGDAPTLRGGAQPVQLQPYTAEFKITRVQTLADGTTITHESEETRVRDSQFRTLTTHSIVQPDGQEAYTETFVNDPVEGTQMSWDSRTRKAKLIRLPARDRRVGCWADDAGNARFNFSAGQARGMASVPQVSSTPARLKREVKREDLGTDMLMGVMVRGFRLTITTPVGAVGNDRPLVSTQEDWMAPSLGGILLRTVYDNPQTGKVTSEVEKLDLSDPPASTFQPPDGYEVVSDEMRQVPCPSANQR